MRMHITRINGQARESTAQTAQHMVADIAHDLGFAEMGIYSYDESGESADSLRSRFDGIIAGMNRGDVVIFQSPSWHTIRYDKVLIDHIKLYGGRVIVFVQDFKSLMFVENRYLLDEMVELLNEAEVLIAPSVQMIQYLQTHGIRENMKFVIQEIWDYTTQIPFREEPKFQKIIHFAGTPEKFRFSNEWNYSVPLKVYARENCLGSNTYSQGWMTSTQLLLELSKGGFGLVWYGDENWQQYMRYNCTFKLSTYLASGIPVIVPRGISNQELIEKNHLGFVVDSIEEAVEKVEHMTEQEYAQYTHSVKEFAYLLRNGYFTKKVLIEAVHTLFRQA